MNFVAVVVPPQAESYEQLVKRRQQEVRNLQARPVQSLWKR